MSAGELIELLLKWPAHLPVEVKLGGSFDNREIQDVKWQGRYVELEVGAPKR